MATRQPPPFQQHIADEICERLAGGESLIAVCKDDHMPPKSVILQWLSREDAFATQYARARQFWAESEFERMFEIADTVLVGQKVKTLPDGKQETITGDMVERAKLQIDTRKWALARMAPKKYGERQAVEHTGKDGEPLTLTVRSVLDRDKS